MNLITNILVKNNQSTIEKTIESILPLKSKITIGDLGCNDQTISICNKYKLKIIPISLNKDTSAAKNYLLKNSENDWVFFVEPYEVLLSTSDSIESLIENPNLYRVNILRGDLVTKETRIWHVSKNVKFKNPVFETTNIKGDYCDVYLASSPEQNNDDLRADLVNSWRERSPLSNEPLYYLSCINLTRKNWRNFLNIADLYLHQEKEISMSFIMTHYYCAMVRCYVEKEINYKEAIKSLVICLSNNPLMAEFWCLLGDVYCAVNEYDKAICFYENAIILGSRRLKDDDWPMEISKYKEYPSRMIESCKKAAQGTRAFKSV